MSSFNQHNAVEFQYRFGCTSKGVHLFCRVSRQNAICNFGDMIVALTVLNLYVFFINTNVFW